MKRSKRSILLQDNGNPHPIPEGYKALSLVDGVLTTVDTSGTETPIGGDAVTAERVAAAGGVLSNPTGITGASAVTNIVSLTQAEYDAIVTPDPSTVYIITA